MSSSCIDESTDQRDRRAEQAERDRVLVARALNGDRQALEDLIVHYRPIAFRIAMAVTGDAAEADDAVQDATIKAVAKLHTCRDAAVFGGWFARIVLFTARNRHRTIRRRLARDDTWGRLASTGAVDPSDVVPERTVVVAALGRLRSDDREVLALRFVADLPEADTAVALGVAPGTVKSRTSRALARLRAEMGEAER